MAEIRKAYDHFASKRAPYDNAYERNSRLCTTSTATVDSMGSNTSGSYDELVFTDIGRTLVRNFTSTALGIMFPSRVDWMIIDIELNDSRAEKTTEDQIICDDVKRRALRRFDTMRVRATLTKVFPDVLIGGAVAIHLQEADDIGRARVRVFPLSTIAIEVIDGVYHRLFVKERLPDMQDDEGASSALDKERCIWTEVNYAKGTVRQEDADGNITDIDDPRPSRWVIISTDMPSPGQHYPDAFVTQHIQTIEQLNVFHGASRDLGGVAAMILAAVRRGSGVSKTELATVLKSVGPQAVELLDPANDITIHSIGGKVNDWVTLDNKIERMEQALKTDFLHGLLTQPMNLRTATEVREVVNQMSAVGFSIYSHLQDYLQTPLAYALLDMEDVTSLEGDRGRMTPVPITGTSALEAQAAADALVQTLGIIAEFDPEFVQTMPTAKLFRRLASARNIDAADLLGDRSDTLDLIRQLMAKAQEAPSETVPLLMEMFKRIIPPEVLSQMQQQMQTPSVLQAAAQMTGGMEQSQQQEITQ